MAEISDFIAILSLYFFAIIMHLKFMLPGMLPKLFKHKKAPHFCEAFCDPAGIRTQDHYIKSVMLYQLSYGIYFV